MNRAGVRRGSVPASPGIARYIPSVAVAGLLGLAVSGYLLLTEYSIPMWHLVEGALK